MIKSLLGRYKVSLLTNFRIARLQQRNPTLKVESGVVIKGDLQNFVLGKNLIIQSGTVIHLGGMEWCEWKGYLGVGDDSVISPNCVLYAAGPGGIRIGRNFDCGPNVGIYASRRDYGKDINSHIFQPVEIGNNVTIFSHAVISPGVKIGDGSVIAAGSIVLNDVPSNVLVAGSPAKVIRANIKDAHVGNH